MERKEEVCMRPIKVLQYGLLTPDGGGGDEYIIEQYRNLDLSKVQYDFLTYEYEEPLLYRIEIECKGGRIFQRIFGRRKHFFQHYYNWYTFFRQHHDYDVFVCNTSSLRDIDGVIFAKIFGVPIRIIHSHNAFTIEDKESFLNSFLCKFNRMFLLRKIATNLFACSNAAGRWLFGENMNFSIINNGIHVNKFAFSLKIRDEKRSFFGLQDKIVFGHTGRFEEQKNHSFLIDIFYEIHQKIENAILLLVGNGSLEEKIKAKVKSLRLGKYVCFLGRRSDVNELLQAMDIFLLPSLFEGFGISLLEAQTAGLKCFASKNVIPNEVNITHSIRFISLKEAARTWAEIIMKNMNYERKDCSEIVRKAGYDAEYSAKFVEAFYIEKVREKRAMEAWK